MVLDSHSINCCACRNQPLVPILKEAKPIH